MKIIKLSIKKFKGILEQSIEFSDINKISGANATGKTSIIDAYFWLLFNTNSEGQTDFGILPYNRKNVYAEVEGVFEIDNNHIVLKKVMKEKYSKKTGQDYTVIGNDYEYYIDNIKVQATQYKTYIEKIVEDMEVFKILSNPKYLLGAMHWTKRREILLKLINTEQIEYELRKKYLIPDVDIAQLREQLRRTKAAIKKTIDEYPVRVNELQGQIIEKDYENLRNEIKKIDDELSLSYDKLKQYDDQQTILLDKKKILSGMEDKLMSLMNAVKNQNNNAQYEYQISKQNYDLFKKNKESYIAKIKENESIISSLEENLSKLRDEYKKINEERYITSDNNTCPVCKQKLPSEMIISANEEAEATFNQSKKAKLDAIVNNANLIKSNIALLQADNQKYQQLINEEVIEPIEPKLIETTDEIEALKKEIDIKREEISNQTITDYEKDKKNIKLIENKKNALINECAQEEINQKIKERIKQLEAELEENIKFLNQKEQEELNIDKFEIEYSSSLENIINDKLGNDITIKLFKQHYNGNIEPCCDIYYKDVLYNDINYSAKINVGLRFIAILSDYYHKYIPICIDNAESINQIYDNLESQLILTYVNNNNKLQYEKINKTNIIK